MVSFGLAGGLDPSLRPGDLVLPKGIAVPDGKILPCDPGLRDRWLAASTAGGLRAVGGRLLGSEQAVARVEDKRSLHAATGAVAVDMESHAVALAAARGGTPCIAVRAIADPAERPLPRSLADCIAPDGKPRMARIAGRVCLRPWEVFALLRLRRDSAAALTSLGRLLGGLGPAGLA